MKINSIKKYVAILLLFATVLFLFGCDEEIYTTEKYYSEESIQRLINSKSYTSKPKISDIELDKYPEEDFLFNNHCFSFYRDMDYFLFSSASYNALGSVLYEYPPQIVRTIKNNGQKSMYFIYETDASTRVFVFFYETDNFGYTRGYPIIMKKSLSTKDFSSLEVGDTMANVEEIDPIAALYKKGYDKVSDKLVEELYVKGQEKISTVHYLNDGIIRINYDRNTLGEYVINKIITSHDFTIPSLTGNLCYKIYPDDLVK